MLRTPLNERKLPNYTRSQETANMLTHAAGVLIGLVVIAFLVKKQSKGPALIGGIVYAFSIVCLFTVSSVYHGLRPCYGKKVMQAVDHCTIYLLIAGSYTPILLSAIMPAYPGIARLLFIAEWSLAVIATAFTAIDHNRYGKQAMCCYIGMGWLVVFALKPTVEALGLEGVLWLLFGGIAYTLGAVIYGLGKKKPALHTVFHVFVDIGCALQAVCIIKYVL